MRTPFVAGNWKMNTNGDQAEALATELVERLGQDDRVEIIVCPPYPYLIRVESVLQGSRIALGAQNIYPDRKGAYTGEVSPTMLVDCGCQWVIIGHSERRHLLGETDDFIHRKIIGAIKNGLSVILCVGETLSQREAQQTESIIEQQLAGALESIPTDKFGRLVIAYEPVWAIGTGHTATPEQAQVVHRFIREWLDGQFGASTAEDTRFVYGGSVKPDNAADLIKQPDVDGALVGGASLDADDFSAIVQAAITSKGR